MSLVTDTMTPCERARFNRLRRTHYIRKFGLVCTNPARDMREGYLDQLDFCVDDSARRLLLGLGEKESAA